MGREEKRKYAKKTGKNIEKIIPKDDKNLKKYLKLTGIIIVFLSIFYILSALFITKELDWFNKNNTNNTSETVSNIILAKNTFRQVEEDYYVYFYNFNEENKDISNSLSNLSEYKIYKVNTNDALNTNYVKEVGNPLASDLKSLQVINPTLIKISNERVSEYYETTDNILLYLNNL